MFRDVATIVADKCVNPETQRPYTVGIIERAMKDAHVSIKPQKNTKQQVPPSSLPLSLSHYCLLIQALEVIRILQDNIPLQRASMKLRLTLPAREARRVREKMLPHLTIQHEEWENQQLNIVST